MSDSGADSSPSGCPVCRAVPASRGELRLTHVRNLYEGPHEGYALFACPECQRPFLEQFQEITWLPGGEDDIWIRWMPIMDEERAEIERLIPETTEEDENVYHLAKLMHRRGRLVLDPDGNFAWYDSPYDAGNLYPPG